MSLRAFSNRLTITPHSVRCSFKPENRNSLDAPKTWSYKTDNSQLSIVFKAICMEVQKIIKGEYIDSTDTGEVVFELLYDDGTKVKESYWADIKDLPDIFTSIGMKEKYKVFVDDSFSEHFFYKENGEWRDVLK